MPPAANARSAPIAARQSDPQAFDALFAEVYDELRRLARIRLRARGRTPVLSTTTLVHESYLRLAGNGSLQLNDRAHFLSYAARAMRSVIIDLVRKRQASRHGGGAAHVTLDTRLANNVLVAERELLGVHDALDALATLDPRMVRIVEMRYFAGMTEVEIAAALGLTDRTVRREWEKARLWLASALEERDIAR